MKSIWNESSCIFFFFVFFFPCVHFSFCTSVNKLQAVWSSTIEFIFLQTWQQSRMKPIWDATLADHWLPRPKVLSEVRGFTSCSVPVKLPPMIALVRSRIKSEALISTEQVLSHPSWKVLCSTYVPFSVLFIVAPSLSLLGTLFINGLGSSKSLTWPSNLMGLSKVQ